MKVTDLFAGVIGLVYLAAAIVALCFAVFGVITAGMQNLILGVLTLFIPFAGLIQGVVLFFFNYNIAEHLLKLFAGG